MNESVEEFCVKYPKKAKKIKRAFKFSNKDLNAREVKDSLNKSLIEGCKALLRYYKSRNLEERIPYKASVIFEDVWNEADALLKDKFCFRGVKGKLKRNEEKNIVWDDYGPEGDVEWAYYVNRHFYLREVLKKFKQTREKKYAQYIETFLQDWILSNPPPRLFFVKNPQWRVLEAGLRILVVWVELFYECLHIPQVSDFTSLLMLQSIYKHLRYLRYWPARHGNHLVMEMDALAMGCVAFPEIKKAHKWLKKAHKRMEKEITENQVYPDGVQNEMTAHYHEVALHHFEHIAKLLKTQGIIVSKEYRVVLEKMWDYLVYTMRPNGTEPLNNDSNLVDNRDLYSKKSKEYNRDDWLFIATNGKKGKKPENKFLNYYPWAGQLICRSGWTDEEIWSFFDFGPWGMAHQHRDKLHISIHAYGRDILVDSGPFRYKRDKWRDRYFQASRGHNVLLIDNKGQKPTEHTVKDIPDRICIIRESFAFVRDAYNDQFAHEGVGGKGKTNNPTKRAIKHQRSLLYVQSQFWLVVDEVFLDKPREIKALWHYHPSCTLNVDAKEISTLDKDTGNLLLLPIGENRWKIEKIRGKKQEPPQGWYSPRYNERIESNCVAFTKRTRSPQNTERFGWLIVPYKGKKPKIKVNIDLNPQKVQGEVRMNKNKTSFSWSLNDPQKIFVKRENFGKIK